MKLTEQNCSRIFIQTRKVDIFGVELPGIRSHVTPPTPATSLIARDFFPRSNESENCNTRDESNEKRTWPWNEIKDKSLDIGAIHEWLKGRNVPFSLTSTYHALIPGPLIYYAYVDTCWRLSHMVNSQ